jgi:serine/alanine adding enzyme
MEIATEISEEEWRDFIERTPGGSIFQSPEMTRVFRQTKGYQPHVVASLRGDNVTGLLSSVTVSYHVGRLSPLGSRAIVIGGPIGDPTAFSTLLAAHDNLASKGALLTQIRNLTSPLDWTPFTSSGYGWEDHLNYLIDLRGGEDAIFAGMSKARRRGIAVAEKAGLAIRKVDRSDLNQAYQLLHLTYRRAGIPLADPGLFRSALDILSRSGSILARAALLGADVCAARFVLRSNHMLYDWYAGSSDLGRQVHADEWLVWAILQEGVAKGCSTFDFGGAGRPNESYGPREFKRRFGGSEVNPGRFEKVYRPITSRVTKAAYNLWRRWR